MFVSLCFSSSLVANTSFSFVIDNSGNILFSLVAKDFDGRPLLVVVEETSDGTTHVWAASVDPHVLVVL